MHGHERIASRHLEDPRAISGAVWRISRILRGILFLNPWRYLKSFSEYSILIPIEKLYADGVATQFGLAGSYLRNYTSCSQSDKSRSMLGNSDDATVSHIVSIFGCLHILNLSQDAHAQILNCSRTE